MFVNLWKFCVTFVSNTFVILGSIWIKCSSITFVTQGIQWKGHKIWLAA